jgi:hypothetical protein
MGVVGSIRETEPLAPPKVGVRQDEVSRYLNNGFSLIKERNGDGTKPSPVTSEEPD